MKKCTKCTLEKPLNEFHSNISMIDGKQHYCKSCINSNYSPVRYKKDINKHRDWQYKRKYGITLQQYNQILATQNNACKICLGKEVRRDRKGKVRELAVDHNHITGEVRGLLCQRCNQAVGLMDDNHKLFLSACEYLMKRKAA